MAKTNHLLIKGAEAIGVWIGGLGMNEPEVAEANMKVLLGLAAEGKLKPAISHRFPLGEASACLQAIVERAVIGKAVLVG